MRLSAALRSLPLWLVFIVPLFAASALLGESASAQSQPPHPLNDTGIDWCADGSRNNLSCPVSGYPGQDGEYGRDVTDHDDRDGHAGFSYTKLDAQGRELPADASAWSCVRDNVTGAIWEVKTDDGGLRDKDWTYSWYDPDSPDGVPGTEDGGTCATAGRCDTEKYVEDVNAQGLCGFSDWRMPTIKELAGITHLGRTDPSIDTGYFPNTLSSWFWSASPGAGYSDHAWSVPFDGGYDGSSSKGNGYRVRLVREGQWSLSFVDNGDGTISDANTGLMWAQCSAGQSGTDCGTGSADGMAWQQALSYAENATFAGYNDWRLPNRRELRSLVDYNTYGPAIDEAFFPATPSDWFWSASPFANYSDGAWYVNFSSGYDGSYYKYNPYRVRLVREGQWFGLLSLSVSVSGNGSGTVTSSPAGINCGSDCSEAYEPGTEITLTATPAAGSALTGWSETSCGTATRCTLSLDSAKTVTVTFARISHAIQTSANPSNGGTLSCTPNPVNHGSSSTCTANPASGYRFIGWSGDCSGTSLSCTLSNVTNPQAVTASFERQTYNIQTSADPSAGGSLSCSPNPVNHGSSSLCLVSANSGYRFTGWGDDCASAGTATSCTLGNVTSAKTVSAQFTPVGSGPRATHAAPETYVPGSLVTVTNHFSDPGSDRVSLVWRPQLPLGWTIEAVDGDGIPQVDEANEIVFFGALSPPLELNFRYHVRVPSGDRDSKTITAVVKYRHTQPTDQELIPEPGTLWLRQQQIRRHHADYLEPYWTINATELNRVLSYWRHGGYHRDPSSPDGYAEGTGASDGQRHDADYQDPAWRIDSFEVNRLAAYWRARDYHTEPAGFDGYAPGEPARGSSERLGADATLPASAQAPQTSHSASLSHYCPGGTLRIDNRIGQTGDAPPLALLWHPRLPPGWTIVSVQGDRGPVLSPDGDAILFLEEQLRLPLDFSYQVRIPSDASGPQTLAAELSYQDIDMTNPATTAPSPLSLSDDSGEDDGGCSPAAIQLSSPITSGRNQHWRSEHRIQVAGTVSVATAARLELRAPRIDFAPGFRVLPGGQLSAIADAGVTCPADRAILDPRPAAATSTRTAPEAMSAEAEETIGLTESAAAAAAVTAAPILVTDPAALPVWLHDQLHALGIDPDPSTLTSSLVDADEHWLILETRQALHEGDHNGVSDLYHLDLLSDQLRLISATEQGRAGNGPSRHPAADARGELIVFESEADDLVASDTNAVSDIYLHDLALGQTLRLTDALGASAHPGIDAQGQEILYDQRSDEGRRAVLITATATGSGEAATRLSLATVPDGHSVDAHHPAISPDGRFVVYLEQKALGAADAPRACQIHLYDRTTQVYHRQPCPPALAEASEQARPAFSPRGDQLQWWLPGQARPLTLRNPLHPELP
ncbi:MAG: hypothetical protein C1943_18250 [Halochromatium sp.]|nr:hypothetical protein [Halochromatium sp.]